MGVFALCAAVTQCSKLSEETLPTWYFDEDGDGEGNVSDWVSAELPPIRFVDNSLDCNDDDPAVNTSAEEICDNIDNDCNGDIDPLHSVDAPVWYRDNDQDGFGDRRFIAVACEAPMGFVLNDLDRNDDDSAVGR
jgi:hypothetical protein